MFSIAAAVAIVDLATKQLAVTWLSHPIAIAPFFSLSLGFNAGISFGLFQAGSRSASMLLVLLAAGLTVVMGTLAWRSRHPVERVGFALIIGGAVGNMIDRAADGRVTDFLDFHVGVWRWPTFNGADTAITAGVALLLSVIVFGDRKPPQLNLNEPKD